MSSAVNHSRRSHRSNYRIRSAVGNIARRRAYSAVAPSRAFTDRMNDMLRAFFASGAYRRRKTPEAPAGSEAAE